MQLEKIPHRALVAVRITTLGLENLSNKLFLNRWNADLIDKAEEKVSIFELKSTSMYYYTACNCTVK